MWTLTGEGKPGKMYIRTPEGKKGSGEEIGSAKKLKRLGPLSPKQVHSENNLCSVHYSSLI